MLRLTAQCNDFLVTKGEFCVPQGAAEAENRLVRATGNAVYASCHEDCMRRQDNVGHVGVSCGWGCGVQRQTQGAGEPWA